MQTKNTFNTKKLGLFGLVTVATLGATALANAELTQFKKEIPFQLLLRRMVRQWTKSSQKMASKMLIRFILVKN